jgi:hypothetical protein
LRPRVEYQATAGAIRELPRPWPFDPRLNRASAALVTVAAAAHASTEMVPLDLCQSVSGKDPSRARRLGITARRLKPVHEHELLDAIVRAMGRGEDEPIAAPAGTAIAESPPDGPRRWRILVAEDNEFNRELREHLLGHRGHSVVIAKDGREALAMLGARGLRPDAGRRPEAGAGRLPGRPPGEGAGAPGRPISSPARDRPDGHVEAGRPRPLPGGRHG